MSAKGKTVRAKKSAVADVEVAEKCEPVDSGIVDDGIAGGIAVVSDDDMRARVVVLEDTVCGLIKRLDEYENDYKSHHNLINKSVCLNTAEIAGLKLTVDKLSVGLGGEGASVTSKPSTSAPGGGRSVVSRQKISTFFHSYMIDNDEFRARMLAEFKDVIAGDKKIKSKKTDATRLKQTATVVWELISGGDEKYAGLLAEITDLYKSR